MISLFYMLTVLMQLKISSSITQTQRQYVQYFINTPLFWYNIAFFVITIIPYSIIACRKTPENDYLIMRNILKTENKISRIQLTLWNISNNALCIFNVKTLLEMVIYPILYWYNNDQTGVTCNTIIASFFYLGAFYCSLEIWTMFVTVTYRAVFDTFTLWKFAMQRSRVSETVQV